MRNEHGLLLWDVDGTLLDAHGRARSAWESAFFQAWNIPHALSGIELRGATDSRVMRLVHAQHHLNPADRLGVFKQAYRRTLLSNLHAVPPTPTAGAAAFIARMQQMGWLQAVATGNFYVGANWKLRKAGLRQYFTWGAYAEQAEERADILRVALNRVIRRTHLTPQTIVVVGDTAHDVAAAHTVGAPCVGVAQNPRQAWDLEQCGADLVVENFTDSDRIVRWLTLGRKD